MKRHHLASLTTFWLALLSAIAPAHAANAEAAFQAGYLSAILEREGCLAPGQFRVRVEDGIASVVLEAGAPELPSGLDASLARTPGIHAVRVDRRDATETISPRRERLYSFLGLAEDTEPVPEGDLFAPLIADPKQAQFFIAAGHVDSPLADTTMASVGFGESFGFYRQEGRRPGDGLQIGMSGALFAQFNLEAPSADLVNADYTIGIPVTYRQAPWSARLRLYHQSSHLGDEFLLRVRPERVNLSFESLELLIAYEWPQWRGYVGGEYFLHREPSNLDPAGLHGGLEYRGGRTVLGGRPVAGLDLKSWQEHNWSLDASLKAGLEFGRPGPGQRRLRLMAEAYEGHAPYGQFYADRIRYYGLGMYLGF